MSTGHTRDELAELLQQLAEGDISPAQHARLAEILTANAAARARYCQVMNVHALLHWRERQVPEMPFPPAVVCESAEHVSSSSASILQMNYWRAHKARFAALALALTLLFWAGFYFAILRDGAEDNAVQDHAFIARVSGERSPVWAEGVTPVALDGTLGSGERIDLAGGFLEITFGNEAVVVLEGPGVFIVDTRSGGTLERGRLVARAETKGAQGFSIGTPHALIIDLGTEFGVESFEAAGTNIEVFEGLVEATSRTRGPGRRPPQSVRLRAGQLAKLAPAATEFVLESEGEPLQFVHELPADGQPLQPPVIVPVSVTCSVISEGQHPPEKLIDGSGLSSSGPLSERQHRSAEMVDGLEQVRNYWLGSWDKEVPVRLTFDLGSVQELSSMTIWNYSTVGSEMVRCATEFRYAISSDGENFTEIAEETLVAESSLDRTSTGQVFPLDGMARYVRIEILETVAEDQDVSEVALGEVRFEGVLAD